MTRVSDNNNTAALNYTLNRAKEKLEDLQMKGATLKKITRPSDNPVANVESLTIQSSTKDNQQYMRNINNALVYLNLSEETLGQITEILGKAKDIAIAQSSDLYGPQARANVAQEVAQLRQQLLALSNKRLGNRYIFAGHATLKPPFDHQGNYHGDSGHINVEISKDFFIPINLTGEEVFYNSRLASEIPFDPWQELQTGGMNRPLDLNFHHNIFTLLETLQTALENNQARQIQDLLEPLDAAAAKIISLRTKVSALASSVDYAQNAIEGENLHHAERNSKLVDADIAEIFSDLSKQQQVLRTSYQTAKTSLNQSLLDFIR
ncbi:MAG: flagellar hook-associated protein FlgL [Bacteriovoracaceae bacterium]|nr:flagellar hook-associated protein FlgL [Bacteriovoracaceae bacterium]